MMDDDEIEHGLAVLFAEVWAASLGGLGADGADLEAMLVKTGLVEWRAATETEAATMGEQLEIEPGDQILALTDAGKRVRDAGQA